MSRLSWQQLTLVERVRWLRYLLPPVLVIVVAFYQLGVAQWLSDTYGHPVHYGFEIAFYSFAGPLATWLTLAWVERSLREKEALEREVRARTRQLASLTEASADAILSLDKSGCITSWNRGAERMLGYPADRAVGAKLDLFLADTAALAARRQSLGTVENYDAEARTRDGRLLNVNLTETTLERDGGSASLLIMRDVTARREREAIVEEERARIARDLHDGVAQTLYFTALQADAGRQQLEQDPQQVVETLRQIGTRIRHVIREVRRTIYALRPLDWPEGKFLGALRHFAAGFAEQMGWQLHCEIAADLPPIPSRLQPTIYRVVQESFNNIAKHTNAANVWLTLAPGQSRSLQLTIRDDGPGFIQEQVGEGLGLGQMQVRVRRSGGTITFDGANGEGTVVRAHLPLRENGNE